MHQVFNNGIVTKRTYELKLKDNYPELPEQKEWSEKLCLLYVATRPYPLMVRKGFACIKDNTVITDVIEKQIFEYIGLNYKNRDIYKEIIEILAEKGSQASTHYSPYLFGKTPKENPSSKFENDEKLLGKLKLLKFRKLGHLPLAIIDTTVARTVVGRAAEKIKGHTKNNINQAQNKKESLEAKVGKITLKEWGEKNETQTLIELCEFAEKTCGIGYLYRKAENKKIPDEINQSLEKFEVDWKIISTYLNYRKAKNRPDYVPFSYDEKLSVPLFNNTYYPFKAIRKVPGGFEFDVKIKDYTTTIKTELSAKFLNPTVTYEKISLKNRKGQIKTEYNWIINYTENNKEQTPRKGIIKAIQKLDNYLQLVIDICIPPSHNYTEKEISAVRAYFSSAYTNAPKEQTVAYAKSIPEGFRIMGVDIGAYRPIAYSVYEISFKNESPIFDFLADNRKAYLHKINFGIIGEKTNSYDLFSFIKNDTAALKEQISVAKTKDNFNQKTFHAELSKLEEKVKSVPKNFLNSLSADEYKYLDLQDKLISTRTSIATSTLPADEAKKIIQSQFGGRKVKRRNIRKDHNNKLLHDIQLISRQFKVGLVIMEDFSFKTEESKQKRRLKSLLQMKGLPTSFENKLKENSVFLMTVNPEYSSQTFNMETFGHRDGDDFYPWDQDKGVFLTAIQADLNAANNLAIKAFKQQTDNMTYWAKNKNGKVVVATSDTKENKRLKGKVLKNHGVSIEEFVIPCNETITKITKLYKDPINKNNYTTKKASEIMKEKFNQQKNKFAF